MPPPQLGDATPETWVRTSCESRTLPAVVGSLDDGVALYIAAGRLPQPTRDTLVRRLRSGAEFPALGGYSALRTLSDLCAATHDRVAELPQGPAKLVLTRRARMLTAKLQRLHSDFTMSREHFSAKVSTIRKERKAGIYLDVGERDALFNALCQTPAPQHRTDSTVDFTNRFDAVLYLAGVLCNDISRSRAWHSAVLAAQRTHVDLAEELTDIAVDTIALQGIVTDSETAMLAATTRAQRAAIRTRDESIATVWDQIVNRVAALMRIDVTVSRMEEQFRNLDTDQAEQHLDARLAELLSTSGVREISTDNIRLVDEQVGSTDEILLRYQHMLFGDITTLRGRDR